MKETTSKRTMSVCQRLAHRVRTRDVAVTMQQVAVLYNEIETSTLSSDVPLAIH